jgi:hypothetical protein
MKHYLVVFLIAFIFFGNITPVFAHPGNTASDGCHYCRTNCDKWGVPWNERHCHGGGTVNTAPPVAQQTQQIIYPTSTPVPIRIYVPPTDTPTPTLNPSPTPSSTPTIEPTKAPMQIRKTVNQKTKIAPTPTQKKSWWQWLFGF